MTEFVKGQWYTDGKQYWQYIKQGKDANGNTIHYIRLVGDVVEFAYDVDTLIPASLTPDFSNAKEGDECWMYGIGDTKINYAAEDKSHWSISDSENRYTFDRFGYMFLVTENIAEMKVSTTECDLCDAPQLFNSFAQFQAYWAEKALVRELTGTKGDES